MPLLELINAEKKFLDKTVLTGVDLQINPGDYIGLIGSNGQGKTTLLKVFQRDIHLDEGELKTKKNLSIGYLPQVVEIEEEQTLYQFLLETYSDVLELQDKLREIEIQMGSHDQKVRSRAMSRYPGLVEKFKAAGGYEYDSRIRGILKGLGFGEEHLEQPLPLFSGGEKTRAYLARLLLQQPELLLLDEPTNHLDISSQEWLESFLKDYPGAVVVVSHDRYFLDNLANRIWELVGGRLFKYRGNYSAYLREREVRYKNWERRYQKQQEKIARWEEYIRRNIAGVNSNQAKGRRKQLARLEEIPPPPKIVPPMQLRFEVSRSSGYEVFQGQNLSKMYGDRELFSNLDLKVYRGDRIALVGPNGAGKSTLLQIIAGRLKPDSGTIKYGSNVQPGYYDQELRDLSPERNLVQELNTVKRMKEEEARNLLGGFLFRGDDVFEQVSTLSGGEKSRLSLLKLMLQESNFLLLDEPTNHLDIYSRQILEDALQDYPGTMVVVSHDRYFLDKMVNQVWYLTSCGLEIYRGNYRYFLKKKGEKEQQEQSAAQAKRKERERDRHRRRVNKAANSGNKQALLEEIEKHIHCLEQEKEELEACFARGDFYQDRERVIQAKYRYRQLQEELEKYYASWEEALEN